MADEQHPETSDPQGNLTELTHIERFAIIKSLIVHAALREWDDAGKKSDHWLWDSTPERWTQKDENGQFMTAWDDVKRPFLLNCLQTLEPVSALAPSLLEDMDYKATMPGAYDASRSSCAKKSRMTSDPRNSGRSLTLR
jgi:hypothetical protein